jgi:hypothetical protein
VVFSSFPQPRIPAGSISRKNSVKMKYTAEANTADRLPYRRMLRFVGAFGLSREICRVRYRNVDRIKPRMSSRAI